MKILECATNLDVLLLMTLWYTQIELFEGYYPMVQETFLFLDEVEEVCKVIYAPIYIPCFDGP